jgi:hypothetical protein
MSNWYCTFNAAGGAHEVERLKNVLNDLWSRVEIKGSSHDSVSVHTIQSGLLADGWSTDETIVAQFPAIQPDHLHHALSRVRVGIRGAQ